jgi:hypothetical protein
MAEMTNQSSNKPWHSLDRDRYLDRDRDHEHEHSGRSFNVNDTYSHINKKKRGNHHSNDNNVTAMNSTSFYDGTYSGPGENKFANYYLVKSIEKRVDENEQRMKEINLRVHDIQPYVDKEIEMLKNQYILLKKQCDSQQHTIHQLANALALISAKHESERKIHHMYEDEYHRLMIIQNEQIRDSLQLNQQKQQCQLPQNGGSITPNNNNNTNTIVTQGKTPDTPIHVSY